MFSFASPFQISFQGVSDVELGAPTDRVGTCINRSPPIGLLFFTNRPVDNLEAAFAKRSSGNLYQVETAVLADFENRRFRP